MHYLPAWAATSTWILPLVTRRSYSSAISMRRSSALFFTPLTFFISRTQYARSPSNSILASRIPSELLFFSTNLSPFCDKLVLSVVYCTFKRYHNSPKHDGWWCTRGYTQPINSDKLPIFYRVCWRHEWQTQTIASGWIRTRIQDQSRCNKAIQRNSQRHRTFSATHHGRSQTSKLDSSSASWSGEGQPIGGENRWLSLWK